jgi:hypothetical protein
MDEPLSVTTVPQELVERDRLDGLLEYLVAHRRCSLSVTIAPDARPRTVLFQLLAAAVRDGVALVIRDPSGSAARQIARLGLRDILVVEEPA